MGRAGCGCKARLRQIENLEPNRDTRTQRKTKVLLIANWFSLVSLCLCALVHGFRTVLYPAPTAAPRMNRERQPTPIAVRIDKPCSSATPPSTARVVAMIHQRAEHQRRDREAQIEPGVDEAIHAPERRLAETGGRGVTHQQIARRTGQADAQTEHAPSRPARSMRESHRAPSPARTTSTGRAPSTITRS